MAHGGRGRKLKQRFAYGQAKARMGRGMTMRPDSAVGPRGATARPDGGDPILPTGVTAAAAPAYKKMCLVIWKERPKKFPKNPPPFHKWRGSDPKQKLSDWLTNVIYWTAYPQNPIKINPKDKAQVQLWLSIKKCVMANKS